MTNKEYQKFCDDFMKQNPNLEKMLDRLVYLDEEELFFIESIQSLSIKEKLIKIEQYVRDHSFYDRDNKEVMDIKTGKSLDEKLYICKQRIAELKANKPELLEQLTNKKWAGVCADFAIITMAMMRQAGIPTGRLF